MLTISPIRIIPQYRMINFKSNPEREAELSTLQTLNSESDNYYVKSLEIIRKENEARSRASADTSEMAKVRRKIAQDRATFAMIKKIREQLPYPALDNKLSTKMAGFFAQFTCAIQNNSEHDIREFFGDKDTAAKLRRKLSPECKRDSRELRKEIQKAAELQDPVMMLIAANNVKNFTPKAGILNAEQQTKLVEGIKEAITMAIQNGDMSRFDDDDKYAIGEMVQMIKASNSTDFGISVKLQALVDKLNKKKAGLGYIPQVQVRQIQTVVRKVVV